jgi:AbrB family looped-hinge helix DNA binding protein
MLRQKNGEAQAFANDYIDVRRARPNLVGRVYPAGVSHYGKTAQPFQQLSLEKTPNMSNNYHNFISSRDHKMLSSTMTISGQVTIPAELRQLLELNPGDRVLFKAKDDKILMSKQRTDITAAFGLLKSDKKVSSQDIRHAKRHY